MIKIEVMQVCSNPWCQVAVANTFCGSSVLELRHVTVVISRILRRLLGFRKTWAPQQECAKNYWLIHANAKQLQVAIIRFVMCVHLHVSERLPLGGFLWKFAFVIFKKFFRHSPNSAEVGRKQQTLHWELRAFSISRRRWPSYLTRTVFSLSYDLVLKKLYHRALRMVELKLRVSKFKTYRL